MVRCWAVFTLPFLLFASSAARCDDLQPNVSIRAASSEVLSSYRRLLPLEGGSNFRDLGGYPVQDGRYIKRGLLFRSGAMTSLTPADSAYLASFNIQTVVDLRSKEELDLYPNNWARSAGIRYLDSGYSFKGLLQKSAENSSNTTDSFTGGYVSILELLTPELSRYFDVLLSGDVPVVVNCSAGQDRTGVAAALLLSVLGVERALIVEDYLLSTDFRQPANEVGDIDLQAAAASNAFAAMMIKHGQGKSISRPNSLLTPDGTSLIEVTLNAIDQKYGSVGNYMDSVLGVDANKQAQLKRMYLYGQ